MQDESNVRLAEQQTQRTLFKRMRKAIIDGDWVEVDKLCGKMTFQQKAFQYAAYREQFIELIEAQEYQKAFTHLTKRLKPLESSAASLAEFKDLKAMDYDTILCDTCLIEVDCTWPCELACILDLPVDFVGRTCPVCLEYYGCQGCKFLCPYLETLSPTGFSCVEFLFKWVNWKDWNIRFFG